jgi:sulfonate dioxygenase
MSSKIAGPLFDEEIRSHIPPDPPHKEFVPPRDRAFFADPEKKQLLSQATKVEHLTESIGTLLHGIQLSQLNSAQKDELALLVAEVRTSFSPPYPSSLRIPFPALIRIDES